MSRPPFCHAMQPTKCKWHGRVRSKRIQISKQKDKPKLFMGLLKSKNQVCDKNTVVGPTGNGTEGSVTESHCTAKQMPAQ